MVPEVLAKFGVGEKAKHVLLKNGVVVLLAALLVLDQDVNARCIVPYNIQRTLCIRLLLNKILHHVEAELVLVFLFA